MEILSLTPSWTLYEFINLKDQGLDIFKTFATLQNELKRPRSPIRKVFYTECISRFPARKHSINVKNKMASL